MDGNITFGLSTADDTFLTNWNASIVGPQSTPYSGVFYQLKVICGDEYPNTPPFVKFITKINLPCVNQRDGTVINNKLDVCKGWNREKGIGDVMKGIRNAMKVRGIGGCFFVVCL